MNLKLHPLNSPEQESVLQRFASIDVPLQYNPPFIGGGLSQVRALSIRPPLQSLVQSVHFAHFDQPPSITANKFQSIM